MKLQSFCQRPENIKNYTLYLEDAVPLKVSIRGGGKHFIITLDGIDSKEAADKLSGVLIYTKRSQLPKEADESEYYIHDLKDLEVVDNDGRKLGSVIAVHDYGAGTILEIQFDGKTSKKGKPVSDLLPFDNSSFPAVDIEAGRIQYCPAEEVIIPSNKED